MNVPRLIFVLATTLLLGGCEWPVDEERTRITVEVDTPEGLKTGTSVWQTRAYEFWTPLAKGRSTRFIGDAVVVDIGGRKLFAVLLDEQGSPSGAEWVIARSIRAELDIIGTDPRFGEKIDELKRTGAKLTLTRPAVPLLVAFEDINKPATVFRVDPDDLEAAFGPGVRLRRITAEFTEDKVNSGLHKQLPWFDEYYGRYLMGNPIPLGSDPIGNLRADSFARGR